MPEWIPYETDDEPALEVSIDVDLDGDAAFRAAHPYLVTVTVTGFALEAGGQPNDTAGEAIFDLEQRAEAACTARGATPAFTVSGDGRYRLFAYAASDAIVAPLRAALADSAMIVEVSGKRDDAWATYDEYALRGDDLEDARDADLIEQMLESGEDLSREYVVTFEWSMQNEAVVDAAIEALEKAGFDVPEELYDDIIPVGKTMTITPENLEDTRKALGKVLAPFNARYEGWEADIEDEEEEPEL
ncbi:MAG TPA: ribonuclease E inhibitor RraB [Candidatus Baltobacteraceae bacterium]|nr:ribonuclease E inhibitor RraB [Candidatus Baltobacteraceae bacterium]